MKAVTSFDLRCDTILVMKLEASPLLGIQRKCRHPP